MTTAEFMPAQDLTQAPRTTRRGIKAKAKA
jgi:hypothetical protein